MAIKLSWSVRPLNSKYNHTQRKLTHVRIYFHVRVHVCCPQWHDRAWYTRQLFFLLSPIFLHLLPYGYHPLSPLLSLPPTLHSFESTLASLQLLEHVRAASMRDESLRANVGEFWENEARQGEHARTDEELVQEASRMGMGYAGGGDTKLAEGAKAAVESMIAMLSSGSGSRSTTRV